LVVQFFDQLIEHNGIFHIDIHYSSTTLVPGQSGYGIDERQSSE